MASDLPAVSSGTLLFDVDTRAITGAADGGSVETIPDATGNGYDVTQATASAQGTYKAAGINSVASVTFDAVDDAYDSTASLPVTTKTTFFFVCHKTSAADAMLMFISTTAAGQQVASVSSHGLIPYQGTSLTNNHGVLDTSAAHIIVAEFTDGAATALYLDGTLQVSGDAGSNSASGPIHIGWQAGQARYFGGDFSRAACYSGNLTDADRATIDSKLSDTYGITVSDYVSSGTEVDASAAPTWTGTFTADTNLDRQAEAALDIAAAFTAGANLERQAQATASFTATFTAGMTVTGQAASAGAEASWQATFSADMTHIVAATPSSHGRVTVTGTTHAGTRVTVEKQQTFAKVS